MTKLSEQQIAQIDHAFAERRVSNICLSCSDKQLETADYLHGLPVYMHAMGPGAQPIGEVTMSAVRICRHCGHVQHYSLVGLGLDSML